MGKVGLLFGSFNPIHNGHIAIAEKCLSEELVDVVNFVVAEQNPFKEKYSNANSMPTLNRPSMQLQSCPSLP